MAGNLIYSTDYEGNNQLTYPKLFNSTKISYESIIVNNGILYFAAQKQLRNVKLSNGLPLNETNTLLLNLTSTVIGLQVHLPDNGLF